MSEIDSFLTSEEAFPIFARERQSADDYDDDEESEVGKKCIGCEGECDQKMCDKQKCADCNGECDQKMRLPSQLSKQELVQLAQLLKPYLESVEEEDEEEGAPVIEVKRWDLDWKCGCQNEIKTKANEQTPEEKRKQKLKEAFIRLLAAWIALSLDEAVASVRADGSWNEGSFDVEDLAAQTKPILEEAFNIGAADFATKMNVEIKPLSQNPAREFVEQYNFELVKGITDTIKSQLQTTIDKELAAAQEAAKITPEDRRRMEEAGMKPEEIPTARSINQIQQAIAENVNEMPMKRAEVVARTEIARAFSHGSQKQAQELGWKYKYWKVGGNPCGLCESASKKYDKQNPVAIGDPYYQVGDEVLGTDGRTYKMKLPVMTPSDIHPNCNCVNIEQLEKGG